MFGDGKCPAHPITFARPPHQNNRICVRKDIAFSNWLRQKIVEQHVGQLFGLETELDTQPIVL